MKTNVTRPPTAFEPVTLTLTFETQRELDTFAVLFNYVVFSDVLQDMAGIDSSEEISGVLEKYGADMHTLIGAMGAKVESHPCVARKKL